MITGFTNLVGTAGGMPPPSGNAPVASFTFNNPSNVNNSVSFTDTSINSPTAWEWSLNGSLFSIVQNPSYYFSSTGFYTVTLKASNFFGSDTAGHPIQIIP